jgi:hypothetical protein
MEIDGNIVRYNNKNFFIDKFSAYENIKFDYKNFKKFVVCNFSCKFDFSGSELIIEKSFIIIITRRRSYSN